MQNHREPVCPIPNVWSIDQAYRFVAPARAGNWRVAKVWLVNGLVEVERLAAIAGIHS
jgi:hypothetical protein